MLGRQAQPITIGISLKMYFGHSRTLSWAEQIAVLSRTHPAIRADVVELFVAPSFPSLVPAQARLAGTSVRLAAQDIAIWDEGAYTGEVSGRELREIGCSIAEIGHAERRALFGENDQVVALKARAAIRNGLTPLICVGERTRGGMADAIAETVSQLAPVVEDAHEPPASLLVAYEPHWAIGAPEAAPVGHILDVVAGVEEYLQRFDRFAGSRVIYGGSARPGLLTESRGRLRGLFLGRFAHDPGAVREVLDEASALVATR